MAAQLMAWSVPLRPEKRWMPRATTSLPVPVSPRMTADSSVGAIRSMSAAIWSICAPPTSSVNDFAFRSPLTLPSIRYATHFSAPASTNLNMASPTRISWFGSSSTSVTYAPSTIVPLRLPRSLQHPARVLRVDARVLAAHRLLGDADQVRGIAADGQLGGDEDVRRRELLEVGRIEQDEPGALLVRRSGVARIGRVGAVSVARRNAGPVPAHRRSERITLGRLIAGVRCVEWRLRRHRAASQIDARTSSVRRSRSASVPAFSMTKSATFTFSASGICARIRPRTSSSETRIPRTRPTRPEPPREQRPRRAVGRHQRRRSRR